MRSFDGTKGSVSEFGFELGDYVTVQYQADKNSNYFRIFDLPSEGHLFGTIYEIQPNALYVETRTKIGPTTVGIILVEIVDIA